MKPILWGMVLTAINVAVVALWVFMLVSLNPVGFWQRFFALAFVLSVSLPVQLLVAIASGSYYAYLLDEHAKSKRRKR